MMDYYDRTQAYYSCWIGEKDIIQHAEEKVVFIYSEERNKVLYGYPMCYDIWLLRTDDRIFVSYGEKAKNKINEFKNAVTGRYSIDMIFQGLQEIFGRTPSIGIKFLYSGHTGTSSKATLLTYHDYEYYLDFFKTINPGCKNTEWVKEYFNEMVENQMCCDIREGGKIVSCTDMPGMPYMQNFVQEIGINTLE